MPIGAAGAVTLIAAAIPAVAGIASSKVGSSAARDAARIQGSASDRAIAYEKERQERQDKLDEEDRKIAAEKQVFDREQLRLQQQRRQPFVGAGTNAVSRLNDMLGRSNHNTSGPGQNIFAPVPQPNSTVPLNSIGAAGPKMVQMVAPDGSVNSVPENRVQEAQSKGARVVSAYPSSAGGTIAGYDGVDKAALVDASAPGATPSGSAMTGAMVDPRPGGSTGMYSNRYIKMTNPTTGESRPVLFGNVGDLASQGWVSDAGGRK